MEVLLSMRSQTPRAKYNSLFILNLFAMQFISLIALNRLDGFYRKIAQLFLMFANSDNNQAQTIPILVHFGLNIILILTGIILFVNSNFKYRQSLIQIVGIIILNFKYILLIPVGCVNVPPLVSSDVQIQLKICCAFNMVITFILSALQLYTNWSNRFIEKDFCNRRQNSILCLLFQFGFVFSTLVFGSLVGSLFLIAVSLFRAYQVSITVQYYLIQKSTFFYSSLNIYMCIICLSGDKTQFISFADLTFKLLLGVIASIYFSNYATTFINMWYGNSKSLYKFSLRNDNEESSKQSLQVEHQTKLSINYKDIIILSRILFSKFQVIEHGQTAAVEWNLWWQKYSILLAYHKVTCNVDKCQCKGCDVKNQPKVLIQDMRKLTQHLQQIDKTTDIRIMEIYFNIQIANKPLKGYFQIIKMKSEQISATNIVDLQCLIVEARQCFNRIFVVNNIQNSNLPLMKIIKFQELITTLQFQLKMAFQANFNFIDLFTLSSIKISQILLDSKKICDIKKKINQRLEDLVVNYPDSIFVNFLVFMFYQYLQVYKSKQKQLKIISQQKNLKRRLFQKEDEDIFNPQYGVIYIDLVEQRGKIKKITKNICQAYGYNYEDMISFNINQFMPRLFGKNHHKFLTNFIELGKIKILADKKRMLFGKNKNKYIFPVLARLRTEHLLNNEFGVTALIKKHQTTSQFIMFGSNGKIQQITQKIYKILFQANLRNEVDKVRRLCLMKMVPNLVRIITENNSELNPYKTYDSLMIFANSPDMVDKFRIHREVKGNGINSTSANGDSSFLSNSMELDQSNAEFSQASATNFGSCYFTQLFKAFLSQLNITKLTAFNISYKISKLRTEEFHVYLLQVISIQNCQVSFASSIQQYKAIAEYLSIYEEEGIIDQNFQKYTRMLENKDVLNFVFNRNVIVQEKIVKNQHYQHINSKNKTNKKKLMTMVDDNQQNQPFETIPSNSDVDNFQDLANGLVNQQQLIPRGGSERSSVTDQAQSQSKKQMLINAFNSESLGINRTFLLFLNFLILAMFAVLILLAFKSIMGIQSMSNQQINNILTLQIKETYQFRMANAYVDQFYNLRQAHGFNISAVERQQLSSTKQLLSSEFTKILLNLNSLKAMSQSNTGTLFDTINIYDAYLDKNIEISILQLLNQLQYIFRKQLTQQNWEYLKSNYINIHSKLKQIITTQSVLLNTSNQVYNQKQNIIVLGVYEMMIICVVLSWIPVLYMVSQQQKKILNLLSTMNVKQLRKASQKLKFLWQNVKVSKVNQISSLLSMLSDQKVEDVIEHEKQKSLVRNIRIEYQNGSQSLKPKIVVILMVIFLVVFSILPLVYYFTVKYDYNTFSHTINVIQNTHILADKAPILINLYLSNINNVYTSTPIVDYPTILYDEVLKDYFDLTQYISAAKDLANQLINQNGSQYGFSDNICQQVSCSEIDKATDTKFYDQIIDIRNKLSILSPNKLNLQANMNASGIDKWVQQIKADNTLSWVNKIYQFSLLWNNRFKSSIQTVLSNTIKRLTILSGVIIPICMAVMVYIQIRLIKKMSNILKNAQSIHMHFPVHVLVQNTYLTSYFNDKIKNNK